MKSISLYVDKDTYLTRMHPFTKLGSYGHLLYSLESVL